MSDEMDNVEWLRKSSSDEWCGSALNKCADEIERLREENARLRETLQYIADPYNNSTTSKDRLAFLARTAIRENDK